ncbi:MAG: histidine kinase [Bacteroidota bacterium]
MQTKAVSFPNYPSTSTGQIGHKSSVRKRQRQFLVLAWTIIALLTVFQSLLFWESTDQMFWNRTFIFPAVIWIAGLMLIFILVLPGYFLIQKFTGFPKVFLFIGHCALYSVLYIMLIVCFYGIFLGSANWSWYTDMANTIASEGLHNVVKNYLLLISIIFAFEYFERKENLILEKEHVEKELLKAKHLALKAKLQPHFLFNTLNSIVALIEENGQKAEESLIGLSDLLRYSMDIAPKQLIPISEGLDLLKKYLQIEKNRYEEQLEVKWEYGDPNTSFLLPALILQPIVENCIKHGFKGINRILTITIFVDYKAKKIRIANNGNVLPREIKPGTGVEIVKQRLDYHFGKQFSFKLEQQKQWATYEIYLD